jgi:carbonic anhydrase
VEEKMSKFSAYEYRTQPGFDQSKFEGANQAIPMKTLVIHCFDPRAAEIPQKVAEYFGDEVYPGENILDEAGNRVGNTRTLFAETNAGGRAAFALLSVAAMDYIFNVQNVIVVHHSFCGTTTYTPELLIEEFHDHHHADISTLFDRESVESWTSRNRSGMTSGCFVLARQCRKISSSTACSSTLIAAS